MGGNECGEWCLELRVAFYELSYEYNYHYGPIKYPLIHYFIRRRVQLDLYTLYAAPDGTGRFYTS